MAIVATIHNAVDEATFNQAAQLPYELRLHDFQMGMQDVHDFFYDVNEHLAKRGLQRLDDMPRPAIMSGVLSEMLTASLAKHSRVLTENRYFIGISMVIPTWWCRESTQTTQSGPAPTALRSRQRGNPVVRLIPTVRESNGCAFLSTTLARKQNRPVIVIR
jgi:hypothetical protein